MSGLKYTLVVNHPDTLTPVALLAGHPVPDWAEDLVQPDDYEDAGDAAGGEGGGAKPSTKPELEAEIARRNEGRDEADLIVPTGKNKADLVSALEADDQRQQS